MKTIRSRCLSFTAFFLALSLVCSCAGPVADYSKKLASLIDPTKLATLGPRQANPRIHKAVVLLADGEVHGAKPAAVCAAAIKQVNMNPTAGELTKAALLRNLQIARKLGCFDASGILDMRNGRAPTITTGPSTGDQLSVDHIIPIAVVPELDAVIANLELLPMKLNSRKNSKVGERQVALAEKLHAAELLSADGLQKVKRAAIVK